MDPLALGGWDHPDNIIECCRKCNLAKKDINFIDWLERLEQPYRVRARETYVLKHIYEPEDFVPQPKEIVWCHEYDKSLYPVSDDEFHDWVVDQKERGAIDDIGVLQAWVLHASKRLEYRNENPSGYRSYQVPDPTNGCLWSAEYYMGGVTPDEAWWYKERWYAYCEI